METIFSWSGIGQLTNQAVGNRDYAMVQSLLLVIAAPYIVHFDPEANSLSEKFIPPEGLSKGLDGHILGTDQMGRDIFTRLLTGAGSSFIIATCVVAHLLGDRNDSGIDFRLLRRDCRYDYYENNGSVYVDPSDCAGDRDCSDDRLQYAQSDPGAGSDVMDQLFQADEK